MPEQKYLSSVFKSSEEVISMILGLVIVLVMVGLVVNYFQKGRGSVEIPGIADSSQNGSVKEGQTQNEEPINKENKYKVKAGDSLWKIALEKYGSGYDYVKIISANKLQNPSALFVGQELILPNISESSTKIVDKEYRVVKGDSLWKISNKVYGDGFGWTKIWNNNKSKIRNPNSLEIGMVLMLE